MYEVKSRLTVFGNDGCGLHLLRQHVNPLIIDGFKDDPTLTILTCQRKYTLITSSGKHPQERTPSCSGEEH